jgi:hypothetical protein
VINWSVSPPAFRLAQLLVLLATAMLIGSRFLPADLRQPVGFVTTICYLAGVAAFVVYFLLR